MHIATYFPLRYLPIVLCGMGISLFTLLFLFITYPATCEQLALLSGGAFTCGLGPGVYLLGFGIALSIIVWVYLLYSALMSSLEYSWEH